MTSWPQSNLSGLAFFPKCRQLLFDFVHKESSLFDSINSNENVSTFNLSHARHFKYGQEYCFHCRLSLPAEIIRFFVCRESSMFVSINYLPRGRASDSTSHRSAVGGLCSLAAERRHLKQHPLSYRLMRMLPHWPFVTLAEG